MMTERLKNLLKLLVFAFLASGVTLVLLFQIQNYNRMQVYLATQAAMPVHKPNGELKVYKNESLGYAFMYPSKLAISTSAGEVELNHQIPYKNTGECNMKGDTQVYDSLTDFRMNISIVQGSVTQVVKQLSPYMPQENFSGNTLKISPGFIDIFEVGKLKGFAIYEGVEGCGHIIYYFPLSEEKVLVVKKNLVQQLSSVVSPEVNQDVLVTPGVINPGQAGFIFNQILKSFQYNSQVSNSIELDTSEWKTYKNEEYGFEFNYPEQWVISSNNGQKIEWESQVQGSSQEVFKKLVFWIEIDPKTKYHSINDIKKANECEGDCFGYGDTKDLIVKNLVGLTTTQCGGDGGCSFGAVLLNKNIAIILNTNSYTEHKLYLKQKISDEEVINAILSTFKFTK